MALILKTKKYSEYELCCENIYKVKYRNIFKKFLKPSKMKF